MKTYSQLTWNVKVFNINSQAIEDYDFLKYHEDLIKQLKKKSATKEEFAKQLHNEMMYRFWSKAEWELIVEITDDGRVLLLPWCGTRDPEGKAIDVTDDTSFDWKTFAEAHISYQIFKYQAKIDVYDQIKWRWTEFVDYCWHTRLKYERRKAKFE